MNSSQNNKYCTLTLNEETYQFPIYQASCGPEVIDVTSLYKQTGAFTYDPGFMSTASCDSTITFIDGEKGILMHRGYKIEELAEKSNFLEVVYLLLHAKLPNQQEFSQFETEIKNRSYIHEQLHHIYRGYARKAHPMSMLIGAVAGLSSFYHNSVDISNPDSRQEACYNMIAKIPTIASIAYKYSYGLPYVYPEENLSFGANFLHMMFSKPGQKYHITETMAKAIETLFILHIDHEQNASTSTVRLCGSSGANPYATIGSGIASLWGPLHGGANEAVIKMLEEIHSVDNIPNFINKAKDKNDPFRLMGFGHRVYKNYDPRAKVLKVLCDQLLDELDIDSELMKIAKELETIALQDEYFVSKKLFPNVDFYSGIMYKALNLPEEMFTVMFAIARTAGWCAQWKEMIETHSKIARPRQIYLGKVSQEYANIKNR